LKRPSSRAIPRVRGEIAAIVSRDPGRRDAVPEQQRDDPDDGTDAGHGAARRAGVAPHRDPRSGVPDCHRGGSGLLEDPREVDGRALAGREVDRPALDDGAVDAEVGRAAVGVADVLDGGADRHLVADPGGLVSHREFGDPERRLAAVDREALRLAVDAQPDLATVT
jgi:hypothetical protein